MNNLDFQQQQKKSRLINFLTTVRFSKTNNFILRKFKFQTPISP